MKHACSLLLGISVLAGCLETGRAAERITIVKADEGAKSTLDLSNLSTGESKAAAAFKTVLRNDLLRSGWFSIPASGPAAIAVTGLCDESGVNLSVRCRVFNAATRKIHLDKTYSMAAAEFRPLAHKVADEIVAAVTGHPGIASTRIALVGNASGTKELYVCDSDGQGLMRITQDKSIVLAPSWSPNAESLYCISFRGGFPQIDFVDLSANPPKREAVARYPGSSLCPAVSPDGRKIALVLSKDGNVSLYAMDLGSRALTRLTTTPGISVASPSWSPDGKQIVYVADSTGRPQLYVMNRDGSGQRRITFQGAENVAPDWGTNNRIVYCSLREGKYQICWTDPAKGGEVQQTNDSTNHEDPSWAPDGRHIVYGRSANYHSSVYILDILGDPEICLTPRSGDWSSPAWSPK